MDKQEFLIGDFKEQSFKDLMSELSKNSLSGILEVFYKKQTFWLFIEKGKIVFAKKKNEHFEERVIDCLIKSNLIKEEIIKEFTEMHIATKKSLSQLLIEERILSVSVYLQIISAVSTLNVVEIMLLNSGEFKFVQTEDIEKQKGVFPVDFEKISLLDNTLELRKKIVKKILNNKFVPVIHKTDSKKKYAKKNFFREFILSDMDFISMIDKFSEAVESKQIIFEHPSPFSLFFKYATAFILRGLFVLILIFILLFSKKVNITNSSFDLSAGNFLRYRILMRKKIFKIKYNRFPDNEEMVIKKIISKKEHFIIKKTGEKNDSN